MVRILRYVSRESDMREQSISQSPYSRTVTLKCDRTYLYDVRDANTHYIRLYEGCEIYPRGKNIWRCQEILSIEKENLLFGNCVSLSTQDFPVRFFFKLHVINDIIILRYNCLKKDAYRYLELNLKYIKWKSGLDSHIF